jgi:hypothetical protein
MINLKKNISEKYLLKIPRDSSYSFLENLISSVASGLPFGLYKGQIIHIGPFDNHLLEMK